MTKCKCGHDEKDHAAGALITRRGVLMQPCLECTTCEGFRLAKCEHPDPKTVPWLICRRCGYFVEGVRVSAATDDVLRERLKELSEPKPER